MSKTYNTDAVEYIAKIADGGMRDAITMMDKCLAYSPELTLQNVVDVLGVADYDDMVSLTDNIIEGKISEVIGIVEQFHSAGKDLKQFIKTYLQFLLDIQKVAVGCEWQFINIPQLPTYTDWLKSMGDYEFDVCLRLMELMMKINTEVKYSSSVKYDLEAYLMQFMKGVGE